MAFSNWGNGSQVKNAMQTSANIPVTTARIHRGSGRAEAHRSSALGGAFEPHSFPFNTYDTLRDRSQPAGANPMMKNAKLETTAVSNSSQ